MATFYETEPPDAESSQFLLLEKQESLTRSDHSTKVKHFWSTKLLACNITLLVANLLVAWVLVFYLAASREVQLVTGDFTKSAIEMELRPFEDTFRDDGHSKYRGNPRQELDEAWVDLIKGYNVRVPPSVPLPSPAPNRTLVEIPDGSGDHYVIPSVLHELHCLRTIRELFFPEDYPKNYQRFRPREGERINIHVDHCFDALRQASMCHADMTLVPWEHTPELRIPIRNVFHAPHKCANWNRLDQWLVKHSFDPFASGWLTREMFEPE